MKRSIEHYIEAMSSPPSEVLKELYRYTYLKTYYPRMISGPVQGKLLAFICRMLRPEKVLEIGTFTGYTAISMAEALPGDSLLTTIEADEELEPLILSYLKKAGVENKVHLIIGDAKEVLQHTDGPFDLIFLDADKTSYPTYYQQLKPLLRPNGFLITDNVLWAGKVNVDEITDSATTAIRRFNELVAADVEVEQLILPLRDGLSIIRKL